MSGIARLSDDLLSHILCLASGSDIARKLSMAQVSAHWRHIALGSPLLWSRICLSAKRDCRLLHLVLERCGPSVLLDFEVSGVEVSGAGFRITGHAPQELEVAMRALEPYAARIRSIKTTIWFNALLSVNLEFPELRTLRVRTKVLTRFVRLRAPNLRVLDLKNVSLNELPPLLSQNLSELHVDNCTGVWPRDLADVVARCVHLVRLTFSSSDYIWRHAPRLEIPAEGLPRLRHLRTAEFCMPIPLLVNVLNYAIDQDALCSLLLYFPTHPTSEELSILWATLPFRAGHIAQLEMEDFESIGIRDDAGREVSTSLYYEVRPPSARLWPCIANAFHAHETVRELTIPIDAWNDIVEDLMGYPPSAVRTLRLLIYTSEDGSFSSDPKVQFLLLDRVEFYAAEMLFSQRKPFLAALVVTVLQLIVCDDKRPLEVVVFAQVDDAEVDQMRDLLKREGGGRWH